MNLYEERGILRAMKMAQNPKQKRGRIVPFPHPLSPYQLILDGHKCYRASGSMEFCLEYAHSNNIEIHE